MILVLADVNRLVRLLRLGKFVMGPWQFGATGKNNLLGGKLGSIYDE